MTTIWGPIVYPNNFDSFTPSLIDNVDEVIANHPNTLAQAIIEIQKKLNLDNQPVKNVGGIQFDPIGKASNPAGVGEPCIWVDNSGGPGFVPTYTDDLGSNYDLRGGGTSAPMLQGVGDPNIPPVIPAFIGHLYQDISIDGVGNTIDSYYVCVSMSIPYWKLVASRPKSGTINPNGVLVGTLCQTYYQTSTGLLYMCVGGTVWSII